MLTTTYAAPGERVVCDPAWGRLMQVTAADVMTRDVTCVTPECPVGELARLMSEWCVSGVPVVDGDGSLLGVVSAADVTRWVAGHPADQQRVGDIYTGVSVAIPPGAHLLACMEEVLEAISSARGREETLRAILNSAVKATRADSGSSGASGSGAGFTGVSFSTTRPRRDFSTASGS